MSELDGQRLCPSACCCAVDVWWESNETDYPTSFFGNDVQIRIRDLPADDSLQATVADPSLIPVTVANPPKAGEDGVNSFTICVDPGHDLSPTPAVLVLEAVAGGGTGPVIATAELTYDAVCRPEITNTTQGDYQGSGWPTDFTWNWALDYGSCTR